MIQGLHNSVSGALVQNGRLEVVSNNIANANNHNFKKEIAIFHHRLAEPLENPEVRYRSNLSKVQLGGGVYMADAWTNHSKPGAIENTNNPMDLMIPGQGLFKLENEDKEVFYKRGGTFKLTKDFFVMDEEEKYYLLDTRGNRIFSGPGATLSFNDQKEVLINGEAGAQIKVVNFDPKDMDWVKKIGNNIYKASRDLEEKEHTEDIRVGALETSNVNYMEEMVEMIQTQRNYELNMKMITMQDQTLQQVVSQVGNIPA
jgi:flagellar basal body rod protein FlgG